jgi:GR25 family glycosyltransferase involved in LPS biosynthesis
MPTVEISEEVLSKLLNGIIRLDALEQSLNINPTSASSVTTNNTNAVDSLKPPTPIYPIFNTTTSSPTSSITNHFNPVASIAPVTSIAPVPTVDSMLSSVMFTPCTDMSSEENSEDEDHVENTVGTKRPRGSFNKITTADWILVHRLMKNFLSEVRTFTEISNYKKQLVTQFNTSTWTINNMVRDDTYQDRFAYEHTITSCYERSSKTKKAISEISKRFGKNCPSISLMVQPEAVRGLNDAIATLFDEDFLEMSATELADAKANVWVNRYVATNPEAIKNPKK